MIEVVTEREPKTDYHHAVVIVRSVDATGDERRYQVALTDDTINGRSILAGKRIDDHEFERDTPDAPTSAVYDVARSWFVEQGYRVYDKTESTKRTAT